MNSYHFITEWRVEGTCGEVADVLGDPVALPRWWPSVYLGVEETRAARFVGRRTPCAGWSPKAGCRTPFAGNLSSTRVTLPIRVHDRRQRRLCRARRVDVRSGWPDRSGSPTTGAFEAEKPLLKTLHARAPAAVRVESSLGDGARGDEPEVGAGAATRDDRRSSRRRSSRLPVRSPMRRLG